MIEVMIFKLIRKNKVGTFLPHMWLKLSWSVQQVLTIYHGKYVAPRWWTSGIGPTRSATAKCEPMTSGQNILIGNLATSTRLLQRFLCDFGCVI